MKNKYIVKKTKDFNNIINNGKFVKNNIFIVYYLPSEDNKMYFGFAVGKKIGNAVIRNKVKRRLRMLVYENQNLFSNKYKYIIMIKKDFINESYELLKNSIIDIIGKVKKNEEN